METSPSSPIWARRVWLSSRFGLPLATWSASSPDKHRLCLLRAVACIQSLLTLIRVKHSLTLLAVLFDSVNVAFFQSSFSRAT
ncbi:hypothetical protein BDZ89DRAFT_796411 [Hymenopellis radicata]|nr:hypothetical protein BDZ89DRAFT_796411 [Hymenopellis radicata]